MNETIRNTLVLTVILVLASIALTFANDVTEPKINEIRDQIFLDKLETIFPDADHASDKGTYQEVYSGDELIGFTVNELAQGYASEISILIGYDTEKNIVGVEIISQLETPGIGSQIIENSFLNQFKEEQYDAITGATISSTTVIDAVKESGGKLP